MTSQINNTHETFPSNFCEDKYQAPIHVSIFQDTESSALLIKAIGHRIRLETFQGSYHEKLRSIFKEAFTPHNSEFDDMNELFGDNNNRVNYGSGSAQSDDKIIQRIERNAKRAFDGNPFTGFAVIDNTSQKIIGFTSIGAGYCPGESQSAVLLNQKYCSDYALETALLLASLAHVYYTNSYEVGPRRQSKALVHSFTTSVWDTNEKALELIHKLGLKYICPLNPKEKYSDNPTSLYGIEVTEAQEIIKKWLPLENLSWEVVKVHN